MSSSTNTTLYARVALDMANIGTAGLGPRGLNHNQEVGIIAIGTIAGLLLLTGLSVALWECYCSHRRPHTRSPIPDEESGMNHDPYPVISLQQCANLGRDASTTGVVAINTATGCTTVGTGAPETSNGRPNRSSVYSVSNLPPARVQNENTMPLSSNRPTRGDLNVARNVFQPGTNSQQITPATEAESSSEHPSYLIFPHLRAPALVARLEGLRDQRRYGIVMEGYDGLEESENEEPSSEPNSSRPQTPGVESKLGVQCQKQMMPNAESFLHNTDEHSHRHSTASIMTEGLWLLADKVLGHHDRLSLRANGDDQANENDSQVQHTKLNNAGSKGQACNTTASDSHSSLQGLVPRSSGSGKLPVRVREADYPHEPFSVSGGTQTSFGKKLELENQAPNLGSVTDLKPVQPTYDPQSPNSRLQESFTHASLVPPPLAIPPRRRKSVHETTSRPDARATLPKRPRPVSAFEPLRIPELPEIKTERPTSFVVRGWKPKDPSGLSDMAATVQRYKAAPDDVIERARWLHEEREWDKEAKKIVLLMADGAGEDLSEDEVERRMKQMKRNSKFAPKEEATKPAEAASSSSFDHDANDDELAQRRRSRRASELYSTTNKPRVPRRPQPVYTPAARPAETPLRENPSSMDYGLPYGLPDPTLRDLGGNRYSY
ncbi:hypothetical protein F5Y01DRAFT_330066 [Xylaria sp. FL0043]|nr:hypothetical protein F5Y01DRAFT_330066 [Xylaria sp. FL0043]